MYIRGAIVVIITSVVIAGLYFLNPSLERVALPKVVVRQRLRNSKKYTSVDG